MIEDEIKIIKSKTKFYKSGNPIEYYKGVDIIGNYYNNPKKEAIQREYWNKKAKIELYNYIIQKSKDFKTKYDIIINSMTKEGRLSISGLVKEARLTYWLYHDMLQLYNKRYNEKLKLKDFKLMQELGKWN